MGKLRKEIEKIKASREEMLSGRWESVNSTIAGFKSKVEAINDELRHTSYKPRREELLAQRKDILNQAKLFYDVEAGEQKKIYEGYKRQFSKLLSMDDETLSSVDLVNLDTSKHNASFLKDVISSYNREEIEYIFEDALFEGNPERARLIQMYSGLKFKAEHEAKGKVDSANRMEIIERAALQRADEESTSVKRVKHLVEGASKGAGGISNGKWSSITSANELTNSIWDEADPWANQALEGDN